MVLLFLGLQKNKPNRRAQGLCFCFFGAVRKNKSNRRAQGLYLWFLWGFQKKTNPIRGQRLKGTFASEKQTEHMPAVRIRFLPPVRPVRELILYISGSVRFGFPTAGFWAVSGSRGSVPGSRFGSRTFLIISLLYLQLIPMIHMFCFSFCQAAPVRKKLGGDGGARGKLPCSTWS